MLSFEEFFHKKKIDLTALQAGDPALYAEFFRHYGAMGEKSFDHSKKFWFNKLRKSYLLAAGEPAPVPEKPLTVSDNAIQPTSDVVPVESRATTPKPAGFKPRFKAAVAKPETTSDESNNPATAPAEDKLQGEEKGTAAVKPAGFKPHLKAAATKAVAAAENSAEPEEEKKQIPESSAPLESKSEETAPAASKPAGFKPRFRAGATKNITAAENSVEPEEEKKQIRESSAPIETKSEETAPTASKPSGFKPRFKAGATKTVAAAENSAEEKEGKETSDTSAPIESKSEETAPTASKPAGFKPRFKAGATKTVAAAENLAEDKEAKETPETAALAESKSEENAPAASKPSGFKPRFKAGATKTVAAAENSAEDKEAKEIPESSAPIESKLEETVPAANKPAGFKPRFKAGATKTIAAAEKTADQEEEKDTPITSESIETKAEETAPTANKPVGFKPRFKAGVTKPSKPKDDQ